MTREVNYFHGIVLDRDKKTEMCYWNAREETVVVVKKEYISRVMRGFFFFTEGW